MQVLVHLRVRDGVEGNPLAYQSGFRLRGVLYFYKGAVRIVGQIYPVEPDTPPKVPPILWVFTEGNESCRSFRGQLMLGVAVAAIGLSCQSSCRVAERGCQHHDRQPQPNQQYFPHLVALPRRTHISYPEKRP